MKCQETYKEHKGYLDKLVELFQKEHVEEKNTFLDLNL